MSDYFQNFEKTCKSDKYFHPTENTEYAGKYFFITKTLLSKRKTPIYYIFTYEAICIGEVKWFPAWRKFCLYPYKDTVWDSNCLKDAVDFIEDANKKYKSKEE